MSKDSQLLSEACVPVPIRWEDFNDQAQLPYGLTSEHVYRAMNDFLQFLGFINQQLHSQGMDRLESILMPASFSGLVGEFMVSSIPRYCSGLVQNHYHNGHPDLIPAGMFTGDAVQYATEGVEIKGSRYRSGWQGHNPEAVWLMVFVFDSNRPRDKFDDAVLPRPFRFDMVLAAKLEKEDWNYSGRKGASRRTITASINASGRAKMKANWIYQAAKTN